MALNAGPNGERSNNGYQTEHDEMYAAIRDGKPLNTGERMIKTTSPPWPAPLLHRKKVPRNDAQLGEQLSDVQLRHAVPLHAVRHAGRDVF